jgi:hypothetical protein
MLEIRVEHGCLDRSNGCRSEQLGEVALTDAGQLGFVGDRWVHGPRDIPEQPERSRTAGVIPDARRDDPTGTNHACHLGDPADRIGHEMDDQLGQCSVEAVVLEGQGLRGAKPNIDSGMSGSRRLDEGLRRVHGGDALEARSGHELRCQGTRAATDIEDSLACPHAGEVRHLRREQNGVPTHESVVGARGDVEAHAAILTRTHRLRP